MPATPELIVDEAGKILITNTNSVLNDTLTVGGYVVAGIGTFILISLVIIIVSKIGDVRTKMNSKYRYYQQR